MSKLTMDYSFTKGKYADKSVAELVNMKGVIFSMIKEGYEFDDDVLNAAHIIKNVSSPKFSFKVGNKTEIGKTNKQHTVETASLKQILAELNTLDKINENINDESVGINIDEIEEGE